MTPNSSLLNRGPQMTVSVRRVVVLYVVGILIGAAAGFATAGVLLGWSHLAC